MVEWLGFGMDFHGYAADDKIIGKATAMLFVLAGVKEVYAPVVSMGQSIHFCTMVSIASTIPKRMALSIGLAPVPA